MKTLLFLLLIQIFSTVVSIDFSFSLALSSSVKKVKTHKLVIIKKNNQEDLDKYPKSSKLSEKSNLEISKPQQKTEIELASDHYADFIKFSSENNLFKKDLCKKAPSLIVYPLNGYDPSQIKLLYSKVNECFFKICDFLKESFITKNFKDRRLENTLKLLFKQLSSCKNPENLDPSPKFLLTTLTSILSNFSKSQKLCPFYNQKMIEIDSLKLLFKDLNQEYSDLELLLLSDNQEESSGEETVEDIRSESYTDTPIIVTASSEDSRFLSLQDEIFCKRHFEELYQVFKEKNLFTTSFASNTPEMLEWKSDSLVLNKKDLEIIKNKYIDLKNKYSEIHSVFKAHFYSMKNELEISGVELILLEDSFETLKIFFEKEEGEEDSLSLIPSILWNSLIRILNNFANTKGLNQFYFEKIKKINELIDLFKDLDYMYTGLENTDNNQLLEALSGSLNDFVFIQEEEKEVESESESAKAETSLKTPSITAFSSFEDLTDSDLSKRELSRTFSDSGFLNASSKNLLGGRSASFQDLRSIKSSDSDDLGLITDEEEAEEKEVESESESESAKAETSLKTPSITPFPSFEDLTDSDLSKRELSRTFSDSGFLNTSSKNLLGGRSASFQDFTDFREGYVNIPSYDDFWENSVLGIEALRKDTGSETSLNGSSASLFPSADLLTEQLESEAKGSLEELVSGDQTVDGERPGLSSPDALIPSQNSTSVEKPSTLSMRSNKSISESSKMIRSGSQKELSSSNEVTLSNDILKSFSEKIKESSNRNRNGFDDYSLSMESFNDHVGRLSEMGRLSKDDLQILSTLKHKIKYVELLDLELKRLIKEIFPLDQGEVRPIFAVDDRSEMFEIIFILLESDLTSLLYKGHQAIDRFLDIFIEFSKVGSEVQVLDSYLRIKDFKKKPKVKIGDRVKILLQRAGLYIRGKKDILDYLSGSQDLNNIGLLKVKNYLESKKGHFSDMSAFLIESSGVDFSSRKNKSLKLSIEKAILKVKPIEESLDMFHQYIQQAKTLFAPLDSQLSEIDINLSSEDGIIRGREEEQHLMAKIALHEFFIDIYDMKKDVRFTPTLISIKKHIKKLDKIDRNDPNRDILIKVKKQLSLALRKGEKVLASMESVDLLSYKITQGVYPLVKETFLDSSSLMFQGITSLEKEGYQIEGLFVERVIPESSDDKARLPEIPKETVYTNEDLQRLKRLNDNFEANIKDLYFSLRSFIELFGEKSFSDTIFRTIYEEMTKTRNFSDMAVSLDFFNDLIDLSQSLEFFPLFSKTRELKRLTAQTLVTLISLRALDNKMSFLNTFSGISAGSRELAKRVEEGNLLPTENTLKTFENISAKLLSLNLTLKNFGIKGIPLNSIKGLSELTTSLERSCFSNNKDLEEFATLVNIVCLICKKESIVFKDLNSFYVDLKEESIPFSTLTYSDRRDRLKFFKKILLNLEKANGVRDSLKDIQDEKILKDAIADLKVLSENLLKKNQVLRKSFEKLVFKVEEVKKMIMPLKTTLVDDTSIEKTLKATLIAVKKEIDSSVTGQLGASA